MKNLEISLGTTNLSLNSNLSSAVLSLQKILDTSKKDQFTNSIYRLSYDQTYLQSSFEGETQFRDQIKVNFMLTKRESSESSYRPVRHKSYFSNSPMMRKKLAFNTPQDEIKSKFDIYENARQKFQKKLTLSKWNTRISFSKVFRQKNQHLQKLLPSNSQLTLQSSKSKSKITIEQFGLKVEKFKKIIHFSLTTQSLNDYEDKFEKLIKSSARTNRSFVLAHTLVFCAKLAKRLSPQNIKLCLFLLTQCYYLTSYSYQELQDLKVEVLVLIGHCCKQLNYQQNAISFYKKALQYTWLKNDVGYETEIYDYIGVAYFYLGKLDKAKFYHQRSVLDLFESFESPLRILSNDIMKNYLKLRDQVVCQPEKISQGLLNKVNLPFIYVENDELQTVRDYIDATDQDQSNTISSNSNLKREYKMNRPSKFQKRQRQSVYQELFNSKKFVLSLKQKNQHQQKFLENKSKSLKNIEFDVYHLIQQLISEHEFSYETYTPKNSQRGTKNNFKLKKYSSIFNDKRRINGSNVQVKIDEQLLKKTIEDRIKSRNEDLKLFQLENSKKQLLMSNLDLNQRVLLSHISHNRCANQDQLVVEELIRVFNLEIEQFKLKVLGFSSNQ